ncbi:MAG TPA: class I SAM-dependent methyltransferase, partial [Candidatus Krumholzibacteria bacterium]|nr:class I SAM-dependent methyltransferase [Candidatus Krumholzibacteria bacterium]
MLADKSRTPGMFTAIAHRYDFLNHALSLNIDRRWRRQLVDACNVKPGEHVLDVATGTGDVAIE